MSKKTQTPPTFKKTYMFQAPLLQFFNSGVFRDLLKPLCAVHRADVYFQHFPGEYLLLLHEHSCCCCGGGGGGGAENQPEDCGGRTAVVAVSALLGELAC